VHVVLPAGFTARLAGNLREILVLESFDRWECRDGDFVTELRSRLDSPNGAGHKASDLAPA
jgi:hypothetical protein